MIDKNDYEARVKSCLKHINEDGQTIQNLLDVFDMLEEIEELEKDKNNRKYENHKKVVDADIERKSKIKFNNEIGQLRAKITTAIKKYIDETMILEKIKEIFCLHSYRYMGVDYRTHPYVYVLKCQKCGKRKYIFGKRPKCEKVPDEEFIVLDSPLSALLRGFKRS